MKIYGRKRERSKKRKHSKVIRKGDSMFHLWIDQS